MTKETNYKKEVLLFLLYCIILFVSLFGDFLGFFGNFFSYGGRIVIALGLSVLFWFIYWDLKGEKE